MRPSQSEWDEALTLLDEVLESRRTTPCHLIVCGGAALIAGAIVSRVTKDVDVLATRGEVDGEISAAWPLPESLKTAVSDVAVDRREARDLDDLKALAPDPDEFRRAAGWLRRTGLDAMAERRLNEITEILGHGND